MAITFLLVVGERLGYQIMSRLSCSHLSQFMQPSMEQTMSLLQLMYPLLRQALPPVLVGQQTIKSLLITFAPA